MLSIVIFSMMLMQVVGYIGSFIFKKEEDRKPFDWTQFSVLVIALIVVLVIKATVFVIKIN